LDSRWRGVDAYDPRRLKRAFTMNSHVKKLGLIDKRIVEQLGVFRLSYRLAIDAKLMERTYQIEESIAALVAERVRRTGEPEGKVVAVLAEDAVAITSVAVDAHVPPAEIATELQEFRLEVREGLAKLDKDMRTMLEGKDGDRQHLRSITKAVNAGVRRDENLLAAVNAGAERDKQILAALTRDGSFKTHVKNISVNLEKKLQHGSARRDKRKNLKDLEIELDYVEPDSFARGGSGVVKLGEYGGETVCIKCINMVGVPVTERMKMYASFATELSIMVRLRNPRVVQVQGIITTDETYLGLVMEYMPGGSLRQALNKEDEIITPEYRRFWASDIAQGMAYLYSCKIEHRDLKSPNVLLTSDAVRESCFTSSCRPGATNVYSMAWRCGFTARSSSRDRANRPTHWSIRTQVGRPRQNFGLWPRQGRRFEDFDDGHDDERRRRRGHPVLHGPGAALGEHIHRKERRLQLCDGALGDL